MGPITASRTAAKPGEISRDRRIGLGVHARPITSPPIFRNERGHAADTNVAVAANFTEPAKEIAHLGCARAGLRQAPPFGGYKQSGWGREMCGN